MKKTTPPTKRKTTWFGVEELRISHGIATQKEMAEKIGISEMQYGMIAKDRSGAMTKRIMDMILNAFPDIGISDIIKVIEVPG